MLIGPVSSFQKMSLLSLTDLSQDIWLDPNQVNIGAFKTTPTYDAYVWDLHSLADFIGEAESLQNSGRKDLGKNPYKTVAKNNSLWSQIWVQEFKDDAGSKAITKMPSFFTVSPFNKIEASKYIYEGSMSLSPLVTAYSGNDLNYNTTETFNGENILYNAILFPGNPFMISSTLPEHQHFSPVFIKQASFHCRGTGAISPVEINVNFSGSRALRSPVLDVQAPEIVNTEINTLQKVYRAASVIDCLVGYNVWTDIETMRKELALSIYTEAQKPSLRIVGINLNISQNVEYKTTEPLKGFQEINGPRFVSINNRQVSGSITYFSRSDSMEQIQTGSLTLYFGGPFLFPMSNVEWQKPETAVKAGDGWTRTYPFLARAADDAITLPFQIGSEGYPASEFAIPSLPITEDNGTNDDGEQ